MRAYSGKAKPGRGRCAALVLAAVPAAAAPATVALSPANARIALTAYAFNLVPVAGQFATFDGQLTADAAHAGACQVRVEVAASSLRMSSAGRTRMATGPRLLDAAHYPRLAYAGDCDGAAATGQLTLHGVTRPLALTAQRTGAEVRAHGSLRRQDFGIAGWPGLVGSRIDVDIAVTLPPALAGTKAGSR